ncbi:hypothetical protein [Mangrovibacterium lignilyticum]|uniref:hypothetical protein n=1 Tax=Mangrovibacterium lignilyticum TaxID=2668052 RepID=UPI0013D5B438|nr:hypothetical protein [Mangrovibacterium lignilyticum]
MDVKQTWEKVIEYATMPLHGSLSRKQRKGVKIQLNEGKILEGATFFLEESVLWVSETQDGQVSNSYYDWAKISSIKTTSNDEK